MTAPTTVARRANDRVGPSLVVAVPARLVRAASRPGAVVLASSLLAFHSAIVSLIGSAGRDNASFALAVGMMSVLLLAVGRLRDGLPAPIHDMAVDHALGRAYGIGLLGIAGLVLAISPSLPAAGGALSGVEPYASMAWAPFVAGVIALAYGMRGLKALAAPIGLLATLGIGQLILPSVVGVMGSALSPLAVTALSAASLTRSRSGADSFDAFSSTAEGRSWPEARRHRSAVIGLAAALVFGVVL